MWAKVVLVFVGGAFGAMMREFFMILVPQGRGDFPVDIFAANILASFLLGLTAGNQRLKNVSDEFVLLVGTGVMGGMSTFSSFVYGAYAELTTVGDLVWGAAYIVASAAVGFAATLLGIRSAGWRATRA